MTTPIVFFDIAGPDIDVLTRFYNEVFGWSTGPGPSFPGIAAIAPVPAVSPLPGNFRQESGEAPTMPSLVYLGVPDVSATLLEIEQHGGDVIAPRFEVPGVVVLGLFRDPAGNPMGLVEMIGDRVRVP
jgi:predicted enzyme related to lactoylglutathione lyase